MWLSGHCFSLICARSAIGASSTSSWRDNFVLFTKGKFYDKGTNTISSWYTGRKSTVNCIYDFLDFIKVFFKGINSFFYVVDFNLFPSWPKIPTCLLAYIIQIVEEESPEEKMPLRLQLLSLPICRRKALPEAAKEGSPLSNKVSMGIFFRQKFPH